MTTEDHQLTPAALAMQLYTACLAQMSPVDASVQTMQFLCEALIFAISASASNDEALYRKTLGVFADMIAKAPRHVLTTQPKPGDRVKLVDGSEDAGRVGTIIAPQPMIPGMEAVAAAQPQAFATMYGKPDHVIVALDAEAGQTAEEAATKAAMTPAQAELLRAWERDISSRPAKGGRGGRGGKRVCVKPSVLVLL